MLKDDTESQNLSNTKVKPHIRELREKKIAVEESLYKTYPWHASWSDGEKRERIKELEARFLKYFKVNNQK